MSVTEALGRDGALLAATDLSISARIGDEERSITSGVRLHVDAGEPIAIVGESGSGKSLTARALMGLLPRGVAATGQVTYRGEGLLDAPAERWRRLRGREITLLPQDPFTLLNPVKRCGEQVVEALRAQRTRLTAAEARAEARHRLAEVGIDQDWVVDAFPFELSGGMQQRVGIAAALAGDPAVLIADEPSTALDVATQRQLFELLERLRAARGMALVLITHDLRLAFSASERVYVLYAGAVLEASPAAAMAAAPLHPYTAGLMLAEPPVDRTLLTLSAIPGSVPAPSEVAGGCRFAPRCAWRRASCTEGEPALREVADGRAVRCDRSEETAGELAARLARTLEAAPPAAPAEPAATPLVSVRGLRVRYRARRRRDAVTAVDGVDLHVDPGESVGIVGESGSGKTTTARCILGLAAHQEGEIRIGDVTLPTGRLPRGSDRRAIARVAQVVFQDPYSSLNPALTIGSALREAAARGGAGAAAQPVEALLETVGLPAAYAARKPVALSGGERQRVAIARALSVRPRLLVCDEPVSALDVSVQAQILTLLRELRGSLGVGFLFISHDLSVVRQVVDRVYVMHRGRVVESGPTGQVLDAPRHDYTRSLIDAVPH